MVARGQAVAAVQDAPGIQLVAPISGTVAHARLQPGKKLSEIVLFAEGDAIAEHDTTPASEVAGLRLLMMASGFWPRLRRRPFGGMPAEGEVPAAIVVTGSDTRPGAASARRALTGRTSALRRGLAALTGLTEGDVFFCTTEPDMPDGGVDAPVHVIRHGNLHPQGAAGILCHSLCPAGVDHPVWDIHAEDVADLGDLLETGVLPQMRLIRISGAGLLRGQSLRTHPGADLRQLTRRLAAPGPTETFSGGMLDGHRASWLGVNDRQVAVVPAQSRMPARHWLVEALLHAPRPVPIIPTAALTQALGAALPAAPLVRALGAGDEEGAQRLGLLSLLEEDLALADYVLGEKGQVMAQLRSLLDRIRKENVA
jgi:Na+-transporting NADH:ubiquinone oxidoreductase subunit A